MLSGVGLGYFLTGKLGSAWFGAWVDVGRIIVELGSDHWGILAWCW